LQDTPLAHVVQQSDALRSGHESQPAPVAAKSAIGSQPSMVAAPTIAGRPLSLQRQAGNQAVLQLMRQQAAPAQRRLASITIVVERPMTPHEFAVRAFMQAFRMPGDVAEQRVSAYEADGRRAGWGPNFEHGVRADEKGKPLSGLRHNYSDVI
jgi:hypothetical protein